MADCEFLTNRSMCVFCFKTCKDNSALKKHTEEHLLMEKPVCDICCKVYRSPYDLTQHYKTKHRNFIYECDSCSKTFKSPCGYQSHVRQKHEIPTTTLYSCSLCHTGFDHKVQFEDHQRKVHDAPKLNCADCENVFVYKSNFIRHHKRCNKDEAFRGKLYGCTKCKPLKRFKQYRYLKEHELSFHSDTAYAYKCNICQKSFNTRSSKWYHMRKCSEA